VNKLVLVLIGIAISLCFAAINYAASGELRAVKNGEAKLVCDMKGGERVIDPDKVVDLVDGVWVFARGSAKSCRVIENVR
jgi:hypothetical protein